jgi:hypothetical protein
MKKTLIVFGLAVLFIGIVVAAVFTGAALVKAQTPVPGSANELPPFAGKRGMMGGGQMHEYMHAALAEKLGMTVEELDAQRDAGDNIWQIAEDKGYSADETVTLMQEARAAAIDKMVADEVLTQEQGDWMKENQGMMRGRGGMSGGCQMQDGRGRMGHRGMMGR